VWPSVCYSCFLSRWEQTRRPNNLLPWGDSRSYWESHATSHWGGVCACSCDGADTVLVSITSPDGGRSDIGPYCTDSDSQPPMLMSGASGSLHVTLTSRSTSAAAAEASTRHGFSANFSFVTGTYNANYCGWNRIPVIFSNNSNSSVPILIIFKRHRCKQFCTATDVTVAWSVCPSVCLSHSCALDGRRCHFARTHCNGQVGMWRPILWTSK